MSCDGVIDCRNHAEAAAVTSDADNNGENRDVAEPESAARRKYMATPRPSGESTLSVAYQGAPYSACSIYRNSAAAVEPTAAKFAVGWRRPRLLHAR